MKYGLGRRLFAFDGTLELISRAKERRGRTINLGIGTSCFPVADFLPEARVPLSDMATYGPPAGEDELREAVCGFLRELHPGIRLSPERIVVTDGGSNALYLALLALAKPGSEVLIPEVHYPSFRAVIDSVAATARLWGLNRSGGTVWPSLEHARSPRTAAILLNSPSNPLATTLSATELRHLASLGLPLISDEVYCGLSTQPAVTALSLREGSSFTVGSFSKLFALPGLRVGFLVVPEDAFDLVRRMRMSLNIATCRSSQFLASRLLLSDPWPLVRAHRRYVEERRSRALEICRRVGLPLVNEGRGEGFYICVDLERLPVSSWDYAKHVLENTGVLICPGTDFVAQGDPRFVRVNTSVEIEPLEEGLERLATHYHRLLEGHGKVAVGQ